jgi:Ca2+-binding EF-hand superfamily protein
MVEVSTQNEHARSFQNITDQEKDLYQGILSPKAFQDLREEFFKDDVDHDGFVDKDQLKNSIKKWFSNSVSDDSLNTLLNKYEHRRVNLYEFIGLYCAEKIAEKWQSLEKDPSYNKMDTDTANAKFIFSIFDAEDNNKIDKRELKHLLRYLGKPSSDDEVNRLLQEFASDKSSFNFDEFFKMFKTLNV